MLHPKANKINRLKLPAFPMEGRTGAEMSVGQVQIHQRRKPGQRNTQSTIGQKR